MLNTSVFPALLSLRPVKSQCQIFIEAIIIEGVAVIIGLLLPLFC